MQSVEVRTKTKNDNKMKTHRKLKFYKIILTSYHHSINKNGYSKYDLKI
jgi:hypothetical protein